MAAQGIVEATYIEAGDRDDPDTAADFDAFADEMRQSESSDAWITVTRVPMDAQGNPRANSRHSAHLFQEPLGANTVADIIERIRSDFMSPGEKGMFRVIGSQKGTRGIKFNKLLSIERAKDKGEASPVGDTFTQMMRAMQESQRLADERMERMMSALTTRVTPASDPIDQMTKMMTAMGAMMGPMMAVVAGRPITPASSPTDDLVKLATTMKTLNGMFGGGGDGDSDSGDILSIVKALAPVAAPALQLMAEGKRGENLRLARAPRPKALPVTPPKAPEKVSAAPTDKAAAPEVLTPEQEAKNNMELAELKKNLDTVCDILEAGKSPAQVAKLVLASVPPDKDEEFLALLDDDDYVNNMALLNPRVDKMREKFEELRKCLLAEYEPDDEQAGK